MVTLTGLHDTVEMTRSDQRALECAGVPPQENLAWVALDHLEERTGRSLPCAVRITKRIPAQAGLGGGSSDAAATLLAANDLFGLGLTATDLEEVAADVGSDVPFFIRGGAQWASGRGEVLEPATAPSFVGLVVFPGFGLSTAAVYHAFDALPAPTGTTPTDGADLDTLLRNDLWPAALSCRPELAHLEGALRSAGAHHTLLCGSGTAMIGFFGDAAAARHAESSFSGVTAVVTFPADSADLTSRG